MNKLFFYNFSKETSDKLKVSMVYQSDSCFYEFNLSDNPVGKIDFFYSGTCETNYNTVPMKVITQKIKKLFLYCFEQIIGIYTHFIDVEQDDLFTFNECSRYISYGLLVHIYDLLLGKKSSPTKKSPSVLKSSDGQPKIACSEHKSSEHKTDDMVDHSNLNNRCITCQTPVPKFTRTGTEIYIPVTPPPLYVRSNAIIGNKNYEYPYIKSENSVIESFIDKYSDMNV
jgi:hypothetical protein